MQAALAFFRDKMWRIPELDLAVMFPMKTSKVSCASYMHKKLYAALAYAYIVHDNWSQTVNSSMFTPFCRGSMCGERSSHCSLSLNLHARNIHTL